MYDVLSTLTCNIIWSAPNNLKDQPGTVSGHQTQPGCQMHLVQVVIICLVFFSLQSSGFTELRTNSGPRVQIKNASPIKMPDRFMAVRFENRNDIFFWEYLWIFSLRSTLINYFITLQRKIVQFKEKVWMLIELR